MGSRRRRGSRWSFGRGGYWLRRALALVVLLSGWYVGREAWPVSSSPDNAAAQELAEGTYRVLRVVDGDTLQLENGERVRLIGVDTPESVAPERPVEPFGKEAAAFTRGAVEGRTVELRFDRERRDRYERILAFVYIGGKLLNEELIRQGFSAAETRFNFDPTMKRRFRAAEQEARQQRRGIWSRGG